MSEQITDGLGIDDPDAIDGARDRGRETTPHARSERDGETLRERIPADAPAETVAGELERGDG